MVRTRAILLLFGAACISISLLSLILTRNRNIDGKEDELRESNIKNQQIPDISYLEFDQILLQTGNGNDYPTQSKSKKNEIGGDSEQLSSESDTNLNHLFFGIGSSRGSWSKRGKFVRTWWDARQVRGYVWMDEIPEKRLSTDPPFGLSSDTSHLHYNGTGVRDYLRLTRIIKDAFALNLPNIRWFVMGDDDTFFSVHGVAALLSKYDHEEMLYIGSMSETHWQNNVNSHGMAFGGGGFAISFPLAAALNETLDDCMERYTEFWGSDQRVSACVSELGVHMTRERGFHQTDLRGSITGLLEAHPLEIFASLHHLELIGVDGCGQFLSRGVSQLKYIPSLSASLDLSVQRERFKATAATPTLTPSI